MTVQTQGFQPKVSAELTIEEVGRHLNLIYGKLYNHTIAIGLKSGSSSSGTTTTTVIGGTNTTVVESGGGVSSFNSSTGAITFFPYLGLVDNQTGVTAYTTQGSDNGSLIVLNSASPIALTLNSTVGQPFFAWVTNQGTGTVTITPDAGTVNGDASFTLLPSYTTLVYFNGGGSPNYVWWASVVPVTPLNFNAVAHEFLTAYNSATGTFSAAQPSFSDISGAATTGQLPAAVVPLVGTSGSLGGSLMTVGQTVTVTVTVTGASSSMAVATSPATYPGAGFVWTAYVSSANTVTVCLTCVAAGTPTASNYNVRVIS